MFGGVEGAVRDFKGGANYYLGKSGIKRAWQHYIDPVARRTGLDSFWDNTQDVLQAAAPYAGVAASMFIPGAPLWAYPLLGAGVGAGMSMLGGGNMTEQFNAGRPGFYSGLGKAAIGYGQGAMSPSTTSSQAVIESGPAADASYAANQPFEIAPVQASGDTSLPTLMDYNTYSSVPGAAPTIGQGGRTDYVTQNYRATPMGTTSYMTPTPTFTPAATGGTSMLGSFNNPMGYAALANMGLGAYGNYQQVQALKEQNRRYNQQVALAQAYLADPTKIPGYAAGKQRRLADLNKQYLAKYGGTEGGAFAKDVMRTGTEYDTQIGQDAYNRQMGLANMYAPGAQAYTQMGGARGGYAQGAQNVVNDYLAYQMLMGML